MKNKLPMRIDYKNYMHWLIDQNRLADIELETVKAILIPIYIALLSMKEVLAIEGTSSLGAMIILIIVIVSISAYILCIDKEDLNFWNDWIAIVNSVM